MAVVTNSEDQSQITPRAVTCLAYNRLIDVLSGRSVPRTCYYVLVSYWESGCKCSA
jgi:hypothetical protein